MFQKGDLIVYGSSGVCRVEEIGPMEGARGADRHRPFYRLALLYGGGTIFAPVDTGTFMRPILTAAEVEALIDRLPSMEPNVCTERSLNLLSVRYHAAFESHKSEDLLQLMKDIYAKGVLSKENGKQLGMIDQRYQKQAEELVYGEFAAALGIPYGEVEDYISRRLAARA